MTTMREKLLTADDLLRLDAEGVRGELMRGVFFQDTPNGASHGEAVMNLGYLLGRVVLKQRLGHLMAGSGYILERNPDTVRAADISYISADRIPLGVRIPGYGEIVPDLAVEVVSFDETMREVSDKARMWLSYGVPLAWVVCPNWQRVYVHPWDGATTMLHEDDTLDGGDVLPGFSCAVSDIFDV